MKTFEYICAGCGEVHRGAPSFSFRYPSPYFDVPEDQREARVRATDDFCEIAPDGNDPDGHRFYFIRVVLDVPIVGADEPFRWGVWVTQSAEAFARYVETYQQDQSQDGSFGWLMVDLPVYNRAEAGAYLESLECDIQWGAAGQRPKAVLWESDHPLAIDQQNGIDWDRAIEIANIATAQFGGC